MSFIVVVAHDIFPLFEVSIIGWFDYTRLSNYWIVIFGSYNKSLNFYHLYSTDPTDPPSQFENVHLL